MIEGGYRTTQSIELGGWRQSAAWVARSSALVHVASEFATGCGKLAHLPAAQVFARFTKQHGPSGGGESCRLASSEIRLAAADAFTSPSRDVDRFEANLTFECGSARFCSAHANPFQQTNAPQVSCIADSEHLFDRRMGKQQFDAFCDGNCSDAMPLRLTA